MVSTDVFFYLVGISGILQVTVSLECYSCTNVTRTQDCKTKTTCAQGEECYTSTAGIGASGTFTLGCKRNSDCITGSPIGLVGRSVGIQNSCHQCCHVSGCNLNICAAGYQVINQVGQCEDDQTFDCAGVSNLFNICSDIHHAKIKCRKYCGLCTLVDGGWSTWESGSRCDVTCGSGHMTRSRSCSNPAPVDGGLNCVGDKTETTPCTLDACPVHGSWSLWSSWGYCSVTCGIGNERRDRSCSNPYPSPTGDHCFGDSRDDRPCFIKACEDGIWSSWSDWGSCSATCLGGLQKRSRTCDNPAPTQLGHACVGNSDDYQECNNKECPHNVIWSTWSDWGSCSVTCLGGLQKRSRTCNNTALTQLGHACAGNSDDYQTCNNKECPHSLPVTFRATHLSTIGSTSLRTLIYTNTEINVGGGYDSTTGIFTAPETGMYAFTAQTCIYAGVSYYLHFVKDGHVEAKVTYYEYNNVNCESSMAYISQTAGDKVWITISGYQVYESGEYVNMFQGTRVGV